MDCYGGQQSDDKQWGYTGEQSNKITFALSYPKAVLGIMVTTGDGIPQNPVDVTLSGATAVGYNSAGCKTYWLAYGIQQWGVVTEEVTATLFPLAFTVTCTSVVMTAVSASGAGGWTAPINTQNITTTSFALRTRSNWVDGDTARYIAVGY